MNASIQHVHVVPAAKDGGAFRCLYCNATHVPKVPAPIAEYVQAGKAFATLHRRCKPAATETGAQPSDLIASTRGAVTPPQPEAS